MTKNKKYFHHEVDKVTGKDQWFFPMEIEVDLNDYEKGSDEYETARQYIENLRQATDINGQKVVCEVGEAQLGFRKFMAVFIPVTHELYLELIKDEMNKQEDMKQDGRCPVPAKIGGVKTCPRRIPNPDYVEGGDAPKTIANSCEGCIYFAKKHEHTEANFSTLSVEGDEGEPMDFEVPSPSNYYDGDKYERLVDHWKAFVQEKAPDLMELSELLALEYLRSEAARKLEMHPSTAKSRKDRLKKLVQEFLDNEV